MSPIRVGLIGCGSFLRHTHLPLLLASGAFQVVGVCDLDLAAARGVRGAAGAAYATDNAAQVLADADIEAVIITTRHDTHAALSVAAAQAGKHVFCEKPMGLSADECCQVVAAVQAAGVVYSVGYNRGLAPLVVEARRLLAPYSDKRLVYHRLQAPFPAEHWTHDPAIGGGRFVGEGCHIFDLICELMPAPPVQVFAAGGTFLDPSRVHIADSGIVTLTFADGSVGTTLVASDGSARFPKESTEVYCAGRALWIDDFTRLTYRDLTPAGDRELTLPRQDKGHRDELAAFARAIRAGAPAPNGLPQALRAALLSFAAVASLATGQPVPISQADYCL